MVVNGTAAVAAAAVVVVEGRRVLGKVAGEVVVVRVLADSRRARSVVSKHAASQESARFVDAGHWQPKLPRW